MNGIISTDRIEKEITLPNSRSRVWRAISDHRQFGAWFGLALDGQFKAGKPAPAKVTIKGYEHMNPDIVVDKIEPERYFSFRWRPNATDPAIDYSSEPRTLVEFTLEEVSGGTKLTIVESGFDSIPASRRTKAFEGNTKGWNSQATKLADYLAANPA